MMDKILYMKTMSRVLSSVSVFIIWQVLSDSVICFEKLANVCKNSIEQTAGTHIANLNSRL